MRFKEQVAIITGGGRGIGFATASRLAAEGAAIAVLDVDADSAARAACALREQGASAVAHAVDVADEDAVRSAVARVQEAYGRIDVLVNAAAIFPFAPFDTMALEAWRRVFAINVEGTLVCCRAAYPFMKARGYGRIINFSTGAFYEGTRDFSAYVASKGAVVGLTRVMATECGAHGVTVNAVSPGIMATEGTLSVPKAREFLAWVETVQQVKRQGEASDIAEAIAYLASPGASFVTGQTVSIDGGICYR